MSFDLRNILKKEMLTPKSFRRMAEEQGVIGALDQYGLDALVMPTFASFHLPSIAGLPIVTVPLGFFPPKTAIVMNLKGTMVSVGPNIPFGIAFIGRRWSEETLISLSYAFEQRTMIRKTMKPYITPTFELGGCQTNAYQADIPLPSTDLNQTLMPSLNTEVIMKISMRSLFSMPWSLLAPADS